MSAETAQWLSLWFWFAVLLGCSVIAAALIVHVRISQQLDQAQREAQALADSKLWLAALRERSEA